MKGAADESPEAVRKAGGLQIIYLPLGHTMTPVSSVYRRHLSS